MSLLDAALVLLQDGCPEAGWYQCSLEEDYTDGICERCWMNYLFAVANHRTTERKRP